MDIQLLPHTANWTSRFNSARSELVRRLPKDGFVAIEHVGSTSVPGLVAQPVVDILIGVSSMRVLDRLEPEMVCLGYYPWHNVPQQLIYQRRNSLRIATHQLHVVEYDQDEWRRQLAFRDLLRNSPQHRAEYAETKLQSINEARPEPSESTNYGAAKSNFIGKLLQQEFA